MSTRPNEQPAVRRSAAAAGWPLLLWWSFAGIMLVAGLRAANLETIDFAEFYASAHAWVVGAPLYAKQNLNPPTFVLLTSPLGALSFGTARIVWLGLGAVSLVISLVIAVRAGAISRERALWVVGACGALISGWMAWQLGQVTWILMLLVTGAWLESRSKRTLRSGFWLGLALAIKPPLALIAICLSWDVMLMAAFVALLVMAAAVLTTGVQAWVDWLHVGSQIDWLGMPLNAAIWSVAARFQNGDISGAGIRELGWAWTAVIVLAVAVLIVRTRQTRETDARWTLAILVSILGSPLGWAYYLPLAYVPAAASWRRMGWITVACLAVPMPILWPFARSHAWSAHAAGALYPLGLLIAWFTWRYQSPSVVSRQSELRGVRGRR